MTTIELTPLTIADLDEVVALENRSYATPWSPRVFRDELSAEDRFYVKAVDSSDLLGYGGLMIIRPEAHITTVVVDPDRRGSGIATKIMVRLVDEAIDGGAESLTLEVRTSNERAQSLYRRFGMAPVGVRKDYYVNEDALIMWVHDIHTDEYGARLGAIRQEYR